MSVIIDMDMPERCEGCRMLEGQHDDGFCHAAQRWLDDDGYWLWYQYQEGDIDGSKPVNCPLSPAPERERWTSVAKGLPRGADTSGELCENVNLLLNDGFVTSGWMNGITGKVYYLAVREDYIQWAPISRVTHWMPLPEPPKEE